MTLSPGIALRALRTASSATACWNLTTISVPPEKSIPSGRPRVTIIAAPARMTITDSAMACQRHLMKLKLELVRKSMCLLNAQLRDLAAREHQFEQRARHEDCGKHIRQ